MLPINNQKTIHTILRIFAKNPDLEIAVPSVLEIMQETMNADGAGFILFENPELVIVNGIDSESIDEFDSFYPLIQTLSSEFHVSSVLPSLFAEEFQGWIVAPLKDNQVLVGFVFLLYTQEVNLQQEELEMLSFILDGLTVVTNATRKQLKYKWLIYNQSQFIRIVTHDLRSPLTSMKGFASMLESSSVGDLNDKQEKFIGKILSGIEQMSALVENIQDAGRYDPETGFYEMEREVCDILDIVRRIVSDQSLPTDKPNLSVSLDFHDIPIVNIDKTMLERAVINLYDNALKYTPDGGIITVKIHLVDDTIVVGVADDGYGIPPDKLEQLFERNFRIYRREHSKVKGSGLGLFIVKSVAQRHGGLAWVESEEGQGSTFYFSIPLSDENLLVASS